MQNNKYTTDDLLYLMARLRDPQIGCPWDIKQDYASIAPSTLEEAYEVVDAIEKQDFVHLKEELGDLLFAVVNVSRYLKVDPEQALRKANQKFEERFSYIETRIGKPLVEASVDEMNHLWDEAKAQQSE